MTTSNDKLKYLCLHCFKIFNNYGECCDLELYSISSKVRIPNHNTSRTDWIRFIQLFLNGYNTTIDQLKRIIEIRKEYNLQTKDQELALVQRTNEPADCSCCGFLDIKRTSALTVKKYKTHESFEFVKELSNFVTVFSENKTTSIYDVNHKYFMMPIYGYDGILFYFPQTISQYCIYETEVSFHEKYDCFTFKITIDKATDEYFDTRTSSFSNTERTVRQYFLIFDTKETAMAFRSIYLEMVTSYFEDNMSHLMYDVLKKEAKSDMEYVMENAPQLLI